MLLSQLGIVHEVFLLREWNPKGAFCQPFSILVIAYAGTTRTSLSGFLILKKTYEKQQ
jgi:hypothetical protein